MKKIAASIAATVMVFTMSACNDGSSSDEPQEPVTVTATPTPDSPLAPETPEAQPETLDEAFVDMLQENTDEFDGIPTSTIVSLANSMCTAWDNGATFEEIGMMFVDEGFDPYDSGFFIGAGTEAYCPQHTAKIEAQLGTNT